MTLLKRESDVRALRDICIETKDGRILLPKGWGGRIIAITKENDESALYVRGINPHTKKAETFFGLNPNDFGTALPNLNEVRVHALYNDGRGNIYGCYA